MLSRADVDSIKPGDTLYHVKEKDSRGAPLKVKVNGKPKVWVTRPKEYTIPVKYGLYNCFYITEANGHEWAKGV